MTQLTDIENNLALVIALEHSKMTVMNDLARCFEQLTVINTDFQQIAQVWKKSAIESQRAVQTMIDGIGAFDSEGKIKAWLDSHKLNPLWMENDE